MRNLTRYFYVKVRRQQFQMFVPDFCYTSDPCIVIMLSAVFLIVYNIQSDPSVAYQLQSSLGT